MELSILRKTIATEDAQYAAEELCSNHGEYQIGLNTGAEAEVVADTEWLQRGECNVEDLALGVHVLDHCVAGGRS